MLSKLRTFWSTFRLTLRLTQNNHFANCHRVFLHVAFVHQVNFLTVKKSRCCNRSAWISLACHVSNFDIQAFFNTDAISCQIYFFLRATNTGVAGFVLTSRFAPPTNFQTMHAQKQKVVSPIEKFSTVQFYMLKVRAWEVDGENDISSGNVFKLFATS